MMRRLISWLAVGALLAVGLAKGPALFAQSKAKAASENIPEIPYDVVQYFTKLPTGLYMGESIGVATNSKGHVFVYTRSGETRLFEFDQNGNFVKEVGQGTTAWRSPIQSASMLRTISGRWTKARTRS